MFKENKKTKKIHKTRKTETSIVCFQSPGTSHFSQTVSRDAVLGSAEFSKSNY